MNSLVTRWNTWSTRTKIITVVIVVVVVGGGAWLLFGHKAAGTTGVAVKLGSIVEQVTVTGNTTPIGDVDLSFPTSGTIASVGAPVASTVTSGQVLASLDTSTLQAQLIGAQANVEAAQAKLGSLQAGATPQSVAVSQASLDAANQTFASAYTSAYSTLTQTYAASQDALQAKIDPYLEGGETAYPSFAFTGNIGAIGQEALADKPKAGTELLKWQEELATLSPNSPPAAIETELANATAHLAVIQKFLSEMSVAAAYATGFPAGSGESLATLQAAVSGAVTEVNTAETSINSANQSIASEKVTVAEAQASLAQTQAPPTSFDISGQEAAVESAQASVDQINAEINQSILRSPIDGTVSVQNAKVGELATPGTTLVTVISKNDLEVDADLPETDIGKVNVNDPVSITFDAFPGETFTGTVFYIDPAETIIDGVVNYKIKIAFSKPDSRIKSGLTANLAITTSEKDNVLILPQFAVLQNDSGSFVEVQDGKTTKQIPVTTGIQDSTGNIEITSGVTEGEQVLNLGLKSGS